jgi:lipid II:glycine glycyltransferase (peptidoglycan interpeptide bridge formation enzyme)
MGGLVAQAPPEPRDIAAVVGDLVSQPALLTSIRPNPLHARPWASVGGHGLRSIPRLAHVVDLRGGAAKVWRGLHKNGRTSVRRALRSGLDVECDTTGRLVPVFYDLLDLSIQRWARQQHEPLALARWRGRRRDPRGKFETLAAALGDVMRVWVAWKDGAPAASIIVLQGANASSTRGAMNKELAAPTSANYLLEWLAIRDACEAGCRYYHLGESGLSRSLARYKERFGARPVPYAEYRIERLPLTRTDALSRSVVKRLLRFRDA